MACVHCFSNSRLHMIVGCGTCIGPELLRKALLAGREVGAPVSDAGIAGAVLRAVQIPGSRQDGRHLGRHAAAVLSAPARRVIGCLHRHRPGTSGFLPLTAHSGLTVWLVLQRQWATRGLGLGLGLS